MQLIERTHSSPVRLLLAPLWAMAVTLLLAMPLILWAGAPLGRAFIELFRGAFGGMLPATETLTRATPLILTGLAAAVAFRARLYNIGAEGQLYMGALAAVLVGGLHGGTGFELSPYLLFPLMLLAGMLAGAVLLLGPALLKTRFGVDEVVTTLLTNFIALLGVSLLLDGAMKDPLSMGWPQSVALRPEMELGKVFEQYRLHNGFFIALAVAAVIAFIVARTRFGFETRAVGANATAARFAGMPVNAVMLKTALLSGALAGLAGVFEVGGRTSYVTLDMSPGYGYTGIVVATLALLNPLGVVLAAIFIAGVLVGADSMSRVIAVPTYIADVIVALALLSMLVTTMLSRYRIQWR
ncbi:MAG: ABC transporter permease [Betaproteobacteria bacterium]|nr:ABC transporter permease [Betaproteobacteria bacterium]